MTRSSVGGLLLTGGASRRMGADKAGLIVDGEPLAARGARLLQRVCDDALEVGPGYSDLPAVIEEPRGAGPATALVAGADALDTDRYLLLGVDLPDVTEALLRLVVRWPGRPTAVPVVEGRVQSVCARYGADSITAARAMLADGRQHPSLEAVLHEVEHDRITPEDWQSIASARAFEDLDTPADLRRRRESDR